MLRHNFLDLTEFACGRLRRRVACASSYNEEPSKHFGTRAILHDRRIRAQEPDQLLSSLTEGRFENEPEVAVSGNGAKRPRVQAESRAPCQQRVHELLRRRSVRNGSKGLEPDHNCRVGLPGIERSQHSVVRWMFRDEVL